MDGIAFMPKRLRWGISLLAYVLATLALAPVAFGETPKAGKDSSNAGAGKPAASSSSGSARSGTRDKSCAGRRFFYPLVAGCASPQQGEGRAK